MESEKIIAGILSHHRRNKQEIIDDLEIQLALLRRKARHYQRHTVVELAGEALACAAKGSKVQLSSKLQALLLEFKNKDYPKQYFFDLGNWPLDFEPLVTKLHDLGEELARYSVSAVAKKSEQAISVLFNQVQADLESIRNFLVSETMRAQVVSLSQGLVALEVFLLDGDFGEEGERKIIDDMLQAGKEVQEILGMLTWHFPQLQAQQDSLAENWNFLVDSIHACYKAVYGARAIVVPQRSGIKEFVVKDF